MTLLAQSPAGYVLVVDSDTFEICLESLRAELGPFALDTERASGYRYHSNAYLIQVKRGSSQVFLIDPIAVPELLPELAELLRTDEWILHAASQDLPCLAEAGMLPTKLFDTELAGRLLGLPRVALGTLTEELLGVELAKEHSAVDWSIRPLKSDWLNYAALDVELLGELRTVLEARLKDSGKLEWLLEECRYLVETADQPPVTRSDPWRRTSGMHLVNTREGLAAVKSLWEARDEIARRLDRAPGRILPDKAITEIAATIRRDKRDVDRHLLREVERFRYRQTARFESTWLTALEQAAKVALQELPPLKVQRTELPRVKLWAEENPEAARWWDALRPRILELAERLELPVENILTPSVFRELCWNHPDDPEAFLIAANARPWQRELVLALLADPNPEEDPND